MATSKHIDKICMAAIAITLVLTILFMCGGALGISVSAKTMAYESTLFDTSYVHQIDIFMDDWNAFIETCENEEYSVCTVLVDGEKYSNIAIRAKGNTSLSNVSSLGSERYSLKLEFDHYEDGKTMDGLDKLCLNNLIQDNTMMKDFLVYRMMREFGVETPLCSYAYLTVNGEDWGLYLAVEGVEESFLERNYGSDAGELYKPDSMSFGGGRGNGKDFDMGDFDFDDLEITKPDASETQSGGQTFDPSTIGGGQTFDPSTIGGGQGFDPSTIGGGQGFDPSTIGGGQTFDPSTIGGGQTFDPSTIGGGENFDPSTIGGGQGGGSIGGMGSDDVKLQYIDDDPDSYSNIFDNAKTDISSADETRLIASLKKLSAYEDLENVLDMDEVLRYFVVHLFVCNDDSYTGTMVHNYYLHECDGKLSMIPWDYNLSCGTFQGNNASSTVNSSIDEPVSGGSADDRPMVGWIFSDESYTAQYHALFSEFLEKWVTNGALQTLIADTAEMIRPYVEKDPTKFCTTEEFEAGVEAISQFYALRAEAVQRQLAGDSTAVDTGDLNLSDMGTMNSGGTSGGGIPTMPDGTGEGGDIPTKPDGTGEGGDIPTKPDGTGEGGDIPTMPDGTGEGGDIPTKPDGTGEGGDIPTRPDAQQGTSNSATGWLLIGLSVLILAVGLLVVFKKK